MKMKFQEKEAMNSSSCFAVRNTEKHVIQPVRVMQCCCHDILTSLFLICSLHFPGFVYFTTLNLLTSPILIWLLIWLTEGRERLVWYLGRMAKKFPINFSAQRQKDKDSGLGMNNYGLIQLCYKRKSSVCLAANHNSWNLELSCYNTAWIFRQLPVWHSTGV